MDEKRFPIIINITKRIRLKDNKIFISGICLTKGINIKGFNLNKINIVIGDNKYNIKFLLKKGIIFISKYRINRYKFEIPLKDLSNIDIQNKIIVNYDDAYYGRIIYNVFDLKKGRYRNSKIMKVDNKSIYLRQTIKNTMYLTVRETCIYDTFKGRFKIFIGYFLSKLYLKNNIVLLYEKECKGYGESASTLYEKLIDKGYKVYYIINKDNALLSEIDDKYKNNFIYKDSLKHIIYFFKCNKFLSSESIDHSMQLRIANRKVQRKLQSKKIQYVFLQHGVMYMVSLNSDLRSGFRKKNIKLHKIVVSSKLEAKHFIDMANFKMDDLYLCGLPKFDKAIKYEDADKIVIMPTWRRWEVNETTTDFENTKYFKMMQRIISGIPKKYIDKIIILPHPLMLSAMKNNPKYKKYIPDENTTYDDILRTCALLITDYSSISYDAFYRGSNVIFYWEEKDECMSKYGEGTKLMLNEKNAFGDVVYNSKELSKIFDNNYMKNQNNKYKNRYKKIVKFSDNKNTERLIKMLIKDKVL